MPTLRTYRIFISHSWAYDDAYKKLVRFLDEHPNFDWSDYSVPKNDPIHDAGNEKELYEAIRAQIAQAHCVIMLAGVYSTHSKWINKEIEISKQLYSKPLVAVEPWGSERTSKVVKDAADAVVGWNSASIVRAIRELAL